jgi:predicted transcriptional regulator
MSKRDIDITSPLPYHMVMARTAFTLRIDAEERAALKILSKLERRPINQLLNEAIKNYLSRKGRRERSLETDLRRLDAYRKKDPKFRRAITKFVEAEATVKDPLEGQPFEESEDTKPSTGPIQSKVREVLGA